MYRMTPFTVGDISRSKVARRKGGRVRLFDPVTARMTGWLKSPKAAPVVYAAMTVAELFPLARSRFGMRVTTKTRKSELVRMLSA